MPFFDDESFEPAPEPTVDQQQQAQQNVRSVEESQQPQSTDAAPASQPDTAAPSNEVPAPEPFAGEGPVEFLPPAEETAPPPPPQEYTPSPPEQAEAEPVVDPEASNEVPPPDLSVPVAQAPTEAPVAAAEPTIIDESAGAADAQPTDEFFYPEEEAGGFGEPVRGDSAPEVFVEEPVYADPVEGDGVLTEAEIQAALDSWAGARPVVGGGKPATISEFRTTEQTWSEPAPEARIMPSPFVDESFRPVIGMPNPFTGHASFHPLSTCGGEESLIAAGLSDNGFAAGGGSIRVQPGARVRLCNDKACTKPAATLKAGCNALPANGAKYILLEKADGTPLLDKAYDWTTSQDEPEPTPIEYSDDWIWGEGEEWIYSDDHDHTHPRPGPVHGTKPNKYFDDGKNGPLSDDTPAFAYQGAGCTGRSAQLAVEDRPTNIVKVRDGIKSVNVPKDARLRLCEDEACTKPVKTLFSGCQKNVDAKGAKWAILDKTAAVYEQPDFKGTPKYLPKGVHKINPCTDKIGSISVPDGLKVAVGKCSTSAFLFKTGGHGNMPGQLQDNSVCVTVSDAPHIRLPTLFTGPDFTEDSQQYREGRTPLQKPMLQDGSSVSVPKGYRATLFKNADCSGQEEIFNRGGHPEMSAAMDDKSKCILVERVVTLKGLDGMLTDYPVGQWELGSACQALEYRSIFVPKGLHATIGPCKAASAKSFTPGDYDFKTGAGFSGSSFCINVEPEHYWGGYDHDHDHDHHHGLYDFYGDGAWTSIGSSAPTTTAPRVAPVAPAPAPVRVADPITFETGSHEAVEVDPSVFESLLASVPRSSGPAARLDEETCALPAPGAEEGAGPLSCAADSAYVEVDADHEFEGAEAAADAHALAAAADECTAFA
eukprot:tig00000073_g1717.t1